MKDSETKKIILRNMNIERDMRTCLSEKFRNTLNVYFDTHKLEKINNFVSKNVEISILPRVVV
jgi:ABC-type bacteriocin/lantibiotic exporter with double-glycine peptidase domain